MKKLMPVFAFFLTLVVWETGIRVFSISPYKLPGPFRVGEALMDLGSSGMLLKSIVASLFRVTWGYLIAVTIAIPLGLFLGIWRFGRDLFNPLIQFLRPISPLAWIPLALLWFGIGDRPAVFLIFLSVFFPMVVFTMSGVTGVKITYLRVAANFGMRGHEFFSRVVLPAAMPNIVVGLRITLGTAWLVIVAAEMIAVKSGLGYLIIDARNALRMDQVIAGMMVIGAVGLILDRVIRQLEKLAEVRWSRFEK